MVLRLFLGEVAMINTIMTLKYGKHSIYWQVKHYGYFSWHQGVHCSSAWSSKGWFTISARVDSTETW